MLGNKYNFTSKDPFCGTYVIKKEVSEIRISSMNSTSKTAKVNDQTSMTIIN